MATAESPRQNARRRHVWANRLTKYIISVPMFKNLKTGSVLKAIAPEPRPTTIIAVSLSKNVFMSHLFSLPLKRFFSLNSTHRLAARDPTKRRRDRRDAARAGVTWDDPVIDRGLLHRLLPSDDLPKPPQASHSREHVGSVWKQPIVQR